MKKLAVILLLFLFNLAYSQPGHLINENFNSGIPANWAHCSGNWGRLPIWAADSGALRELSGPYFGAVINVIQLPPVDLTSIVDPVLEFDLAMAVINPDIQFSVWYATDSTCNRVWDTVNFRYIPKGWNLLSTHSSATTASDHSWTPQNSDYQTISINLSQLKDSTDIRFGLAADYKNGHAYGVWYLDNVKVYSSSAIGIPENSMPSSFRLYPNPADKVVHFVPAEPAQNAALKIVDVKGSVVLERSTASATEEIDISACEPGIYFVHYRCEKGVSVKKLVVR